MRAGGDSWLGDGSVCGNHGLVMAVCAGFLDWDSGGGAEIL